MSNPFTIEIFSTTGDPDGIRIIQKSNWSGVGVVFPRDSLNEVLNEDYTQDYTQRPGVYILVGDLAEETIYVGEADPISVRLKQHLKKDWSWGVFFVDSHGLGKTEVKFLESELVKKFTRNIAKILAMGYLWHGIKSPIHWEVGLSQRPHPSCKNPMDHFYLLATILLICTVGRRGQ